MSNRFESQLRETAELTFQTSSARINERVRQTVEATRLTAVAASATIGPGTREPEGAQDLLEALAASASFSQLWLVAADGRLVADGVGEGSVATLAGRGLDQSRHRYFTDIMAMSAGRIWFSGLNDTALPVVARSEGPSALYFASPIDGPAGERRGFLLAELPLGRLFAPPSDGADRRYSLTGADGASATYPDTEAAAEPVTVPGGAPLPLTRRHGSRLDHFSRISVPDAAGAGQLVLVETVPYAAPATLSNPVFLAGCAGLSLLWIAAFLGFRRVGIAPLTGDRSGGYRQLNAVLDGTAAIICIKDRAGRYILANKVARDFLMLAQTDIAGKSDKDLLPPETAAAAGAYDAKVFERCQPIQNEETLVLNGKTHILLSNRFPIFDADGVPEGLGWVAIDITRQKEVEADLADAKARAETASQEKSMFLANMSHELRTPLNAIIGYGEMLLEEAQSGDDEQLADDLGKINRSGKHLLSLINDILDISKIEAGEMQLYVSPVSIRDVVQSVAASLEPVVEKNDNRLVLKLPEAAPRVMVDEVKLRQILLNLISNAAKFTKSGTIAIAATLVQDKAAGATLAIAVEDDGIGISAEAQKRLFDKFVQANARTSHQFGGTGLGLAICQSFAELMGGQIAVKSDEGLGSCFTLRLPVQLASAASAEPMENQLMTKVSQGNGAGGDAGRRVVVIDDDATSRNILVRHLTAAGFLVATADGGLEGIALVDKLRPSAIVLDILMPDMDGWQTLETLKKNPELCGIPVILASILKEAGKGQLLGAAAYLTKPVGRDELLRAIGGLVPKSAHQAMVVEDDLNTQEMTMRLLEKQGMVVTGANNGKHACSLIRDQGMPELIVLDLAMPEMDGFEFLRCLREMQGGKDVPVIVMTAMDIDVDQRTRLEGDRARIVHKNGIGIDQTLSALTRQISTFLDNRP